MKRNTNREASVKVAALLGVAGVAAVSGNVIWMAAGLGGLVLVSILGKQNAPELAPVRVRLHRVCSRKNRW